MCGLLPAASVARISVLDYLAENLDTMLTANQCDKVVVLRDLNHHVVQNAFITLLVLHNLHNHVTFPTHRSGSSLNPVMPDIPRHPIQCFPLNFIGISDHVSVLTKIQFRNPREENFTRSLWRWEATNWEALLSDPRNMDSGNMLSGDADQQVQRLSDLLHAFQLHWVPHIDHTTKACVQSCFDPECLASGEAKYRG